MRSVPTPGDGKMRRGDPVQRVKQEKVSCFVWLGLSVGWIVTTHTQREVSCSESHESIIPKHPHSARRTMFNLRVLWLT